MIRKALITTVALILFWSLAIKVLPDNLDTTQHQWNYNLIQAQEYLYNVPEVSDKRVILGSSLSKRMVMELLPKNFINLAFGGQSIFDGFEIVKHRSDKPEAIFIEMNIVLREKDEQFQKTLFSPVSFYMKKYISSLQEKNQPVGVLRGLTKERINKDQEIEFNEKAKEKDNVNKAMLNMQKGAYSKKPKRQELEASMERLKQRVAELREEGVTVVFYEMPVHPELCGMEFPRIIRNRFKKEFPPNEYLYIDQPDCSPYRTTDGLHLTRLSAMKFTKLFGRAIEALPIT